MKTYQAPWGRTLIWISGLLGGYRAYVTDLNRTVVLRFWHRMVVISPGDPDNFVNDLTS